MAADLRAGGAWVDGATASELSLHRPSSVSADAVGLTLAQPPAGDNMPTSTAWRRAG